MRKLTILLVMLLLFTGKLFAQVGINSDGSQPDPSAGLDVKFDNKGLLPPRLTHAQMNTIVSPANGLIVYCIDCSNSGTGALAMFINGAWYIFAPTCLGPLFPSAGIHVSAPTQITWNWNAVSDATGYKWSITNSYASATDLGNLLSKTQTGLTCNTPYTCYVWAYNACGNSSATTLNQTTSLNPPATPAAGTHVPSPTQIVWNWNAVSGATGYKWSATNDYALASDLGNILTKTETGLTCNMPYTRFVWAYSACGVSAVTILTQNTVACANPAVPCTGIPTVTYGGKTYNTAQIGSQCWLRENLNFGTMVNGATAQTNNSIPEKYCMNNLESNCDIYGGLYQWAEMVQYYNGATNSASWNPVPEGYVTGLCPQGWHLANEAEWTILTTFLGGENLAGGPLKEGGTIHWASPNTGATNSSGFTALGGGWYDGGGFAHSLYYGHFWVATDNGSTARYRTLNYNNVVVSPGDWSKTTAHAARCVKDTCASVPNTPASGAHVPSQTQVVWKWNTVPGAVGYKWNTTNDYNSAVNMGLVTTRTETGLVCNTGYTRYVWAYNACGKSAIGTLTQTTSACNNPVVPCTGIPTVIYAGKTYNTVQIGTQCWFRENLDIGTRINGVVQQSDNGVVEKYCYGDLDANCTTYGGLYQWNEMMQYSPVIKQGICPFGWHIPAEEEWNILVNVVGSPDTGGKLKEAGFAHWITPNTGATNSSGFTALPGGLLYPNKVYSELTEDCYLWSTTNGGSYATHKTLRYSHANVDTYDNDKTFGFSVRCLKDTCSSYSAASVSIGVSVNPGCAGTQVTFTATPVNGGTNPTYQWKVNMVNAGTGGATYAYAPAIGDVVTCVMTSNQACVSGNPATSNAVTMTVNPVLPVSVSISASANPVSSGAIVTFTATPVNGGSSPVFQWKVNGINIGYNNNIFNYMPGNGDVITCVVTSDLFCASNNPATSNAITMQVTTPGSPCPGNATVSYGSKTYNTVLVGTQCWFKENLNFGTKINAVNEQTNNSTFEKYCYNDLESNCDVYGGLYQWAEVVQYLNGATNTGSWNPIPATDVQGICPSGWHIPADAEWTQLAAFLGGSEVAGGKMKETGLTHWLDQNLASNSSGFTALGCGHREANGIFLNQWEYTNFWSSTESSAQASWSRALGHWSEALWTDENYVKTQGYSVRCIKNICTSAPGSPTSGNHIPSQTQVIWNWGVVPGATGYKWNTEDNFATATDMGTAASKTETGLVCNTSYTRYVWAYNPCGSSQSLSLTQTTVPCSFSCGSPFAINHVAGNISPVSKTVTYSTVTNIPGESSKCWITSNLGADHQANAVDDGTEASAGWYWQFNRKQGYKHDGTTRTPNSIWITSLDEYIDWEEANDPCTLLLGVGWRIPTSTEWANVDAGGNWTDWNGPWNSPLKLHAAGVLLNNDGSLNGRGYPGAPYGKYWAGTQYNSNTGQDLAFAIQLSILGSNNKTYGFPLRCLKEN